MLSISILDIYRHENSVLMCDSDKKCRTYYGLLKHFSISQIKNAKLEFRNQQLAD